MSLINVNEKSQCNYVSYGEIKGKFQIAYSEISDICLDKKSQKNYALIEIKSTYYKLMFDLDYKPTNDLVKQFVGIENEITDYLIIKIIKVLDQIIDKPDSRYVYAIKNIGEGVHLYFPMLIVNRELHLYIYKSICELITKDAQHDIDAIKAVLDVCVCKSNALRLFYCYKDDNYYYPIQEKSTYIFNKKPYEHFHLCLINTTANSYNFDLKIDQQIIAEITYIKTRTVKENNQINNDNEQLLENRNKKSTGAKNAKNNKSINEKEELDNLEDIATVDIGEKKELFIDLLDNLSIKRIDNWESWIHLICLCKTYGLYDEIVHISSRSSKYDANALKRINNIFEKPHNGQQLKIGSLIRWSLEDDFAKTVDILDKYHISLKLNIDKTDDVLLHNIKKPDYLEDSKYISEEAITRMRYEIDKGTKIIIIQAPTGSGKTTVINQLMLYYIEAKGCWPDILSVVSRRSMSATHQSAFKTLNFISYLDPSKCPNIGVINCDINYDRFISSLEHLPQINKHRYDIVILDESNSLVRHLWSSTMDNKRLKAFIKLINYLKRSPLVVAADANMTSMTFSFMNLILKNTFYYRNNHHNKKDTNMIIYTSSCSNESTKLHAICNIIKNDVIDKKSVIIFTDSKALTVKLLEILKQYQNDENYFMLINKDYGTIEELVNCNETFKGKAVITSPKIVYGIDILLYYENVYCVYNHNSGENMMSALEFHQQYSRSRNCKNVHIFVMDAQYDKHNNHYISFKKSKEEDRKLYNQYKTQIQIKCDKYDVMNQFFSLLPIDDCEFTREEAFFDIFYYKSWYDKLFSKNKVQFMVKLAEEAGYNVSYENLKIDGNKNAGNLYGYVKRYYDDISTICQKIFESEDDENIDKRLLKNLTEQVKGRMKLLEFDDLNYETVRELVSDDKKLSTYINKKYLKLSRNEFDELELKLVNNDIPQIAKENKIIKKIKVIFWIENYLNIDRYKISDIKCENIDETKRVLLLNKSKFVILYSGNEKNKKLSERITKRIDKISSVDKLKKFVAGCYNVFGDIIKVNNSVTRFWKNNKHLSNTVYQFEVNDNAQ